MCVKYRLLFSKIGKITVKLVSDTPTGIWSIWRTSLLYWLIHSSGKQYPLSLCDDYMFIPGKPDYFVSLKSSKVTLYNIVGMGKLKKIKIINVPPGGSFDKMNYSIIYGDKSEFSLCRYV
jgi:hypothetical protein